MLRTMLLAAGTALVVGAAEGPLGDPDGWVFQGGTWGFAEGALTQSVETGLATAFWTRRGFTDLELRVRFRIEARGTGVRAAGLILGSAESQGGYRVHYDSLNDQVILTRQQGGQPHQELARQRRVRLETGVWYTAAARREGEQVTVSLDGKAVLSARDPAPLPPGVPGLYSSQGAVEFRDLALAGTGVDLDTPWRLRMSYEVPVLQAAAEILWVKPICQQPGRYLGWPTVCRRRDGEVLAVFSGDRSQHVCPWGVVQLVRSRDEGETWSAPETICNTPLDDRDAGILETPSGVVVVNWFTSLAFAEVGAQSWLKRLEGPEILAEWQRHAAKLTPAIRDQWLGNWTRRSLDGGRSWEEPVAHLGSAPHGGTVCRDGRLIFVGRRNRPGGVPEMVVEESRDEARSWEPIGRVPPRPEDDPQQYHEPHVVEAADGRLIALFRYHYSEPGGGRRREEMCFLRQSESVDGGRTWTPCQVTPMQGYPAHLLRLADGTLVSVYGRRRAPFGEYACLSRDGGRTWGIDREIRLAAAENGDLGYPASTVLGDGSILTVFYQIAAAGEKTSLLATRWRVR